ncbi:MAG: phosphoribosylglycinamide formyltransferase, partial [Desulfobacteraceae bacterium]|nr:phosphoribosylglycinamide formyltransferase [Desulfobacteraceae bacterium]
MTSPIRIGALISGSGTNLEAIMDACESGQISGQMVFTGTDNPEAGGLEKATRRSIPTFAVNYSGVIADWRQAPDNQKLPADFDLDDIRARQSFFSADADPEKRDRFLCTRAIAEAALLENMAPYPFDLLVLAGFMRNLSPYFIDRVNT